MTAKKPPTISHVGMVTGVIALLVGVFFQPISVVCSKVRSDVAYLWESIDEGINAPVITTASTADEIKRANEWFEARRRKRHPSP